MVSGGEGGTSDSGSDPDLSVQSDILDSLVDDIFEKFSIHSSFGLPNMTIKNRKERLKMDRQNDKESPCTSNNGRHSYSYKPYPYVDDRKDNSLNRGPHRVSHLHSNVSKDVESTRSLTFPSFPHVENQMYQPPSGFSILSESQTHDILNTNCDHRPILCDTQSDEPNLSSNFDDCTGNNSEDEYYFGEQFRRNPLSQKNCDNLERLLMEKKGWKIIKVASDGSCLFRSVSHQIFGDENKNDLIRSQVIDYMIKNKEHFSQYLTEDFDHYISRKRHGTCHGNHVEIQAIAELYNRPVEIYYNSVEPINVFHAEYSKEIPIRLSYHGCVHYNSIVDPFNPTFGHGLGMPNYQPGLAEPDLIVRAIHESEATHLEEAMLRDKLTETDQREVERVIENQVIRDSYYEYLSRISVPVPEKVVKESPNSSNLPIPCCGSKLRNDIINCDVASSSKSSTLNSGPSTNSIAADNFPSASSSRQQINSAFMKHISHNMLGLEEDALVAMVMEQSRREYFESLREKQFSNKSLEVDTSDACSPNCTDETVVDNGSQTTHTGVEH